MNNSPIIIVENDADDAELLVSVFKDIGVRNPIKCFTTPVKALEYLRSTTEIPFIIISDINMPKMSGLEFKAIINEDTDIVKKRIPFVFLSTSKENKLVDEAFHLSIQGYFKKPDDIDSLKKIATAIVAYWDHGIFQSPYDINRS